MKNDLSWLGLREKILRQVKDQVRHRLGPEPKDLEKYGAAYGAEFFVRWRTSSKMELLSEVERADLVMAGDFHAHGQSQRTHLRILRELKTDRPVILALECFESKDQKWLDGFMRGKISAEALMARVKWTERWGFTWSHYRPLLDLAREKGFQVRALNRYYSNRTAATLKKRDRHAAKIIVDLNDQQPGCLTYVVFGDLHLARPHLPKEVSRLSSGKKLKTLLVFQNSERIYFQLARKSLEVKTEVVRLGSDRFCVMGTPPWVKWQSYLLHLDRTGDEDLEEQGETDYTEHFQYLVMMLAEEFRLRLKLDDFGVYTSSSPQIWVALKGVLNKTELIVAKNFMMAGQSFFVPAGGLVYLSQATVNHGAALVGQYLQARMSRRARTLWRMPHDYLAAIWVEALSFFTSKIVNHQRKANTPADWRSQLGRDPEVSRESLVLALNFSLRQLSGRTRQRAYRPRRKASYFESARLLGGLLGERLYLGYREGLISRHDVVEFFSKSVEDDDFSKFYKMVVDRVRMVRSANNRKDERL